MSPAIPAPFAIPGGELGSRGFAALNPGHTDTSASAWVDLPSDPATGGKVIALPVAALVS
jgi:hypothetical protein